MLRLGGSFILGISFSTSSSAKDGEVKMALNAYDTRSLLSKWNIMINYLLEFCSWRDPSWGPKDHRNSLHTGNLAMIVWLQHSQCHLHEYESWCWKWCLVKGLSTQNSIPFIIPWQFCRTQQMSSEVIIEPSPFLPFLQKRWLGVTKNAVHPSNN